MQVLLRSPHEDTRARICEAADVSLMCQAMLKKGVGPPSRMMSAGSCGPMKRAKHEKTNTDALRVHPQQRAVTKQFGWASLGCHSSVQGPELVSGLDEPKASIAETTTVIRSATQITGSVFIKCGVP